jgi:hypothetical protein
MKNSYKVIALACALYISVDSYDMPPVGSDPVLAMEQLQKLTKDES